MKRRPMTVVVVERPRVRERDGMPAVLVTGASTGIGEACALHLASRGQLVFAGVRNAADGDRLERDGRGRVVPVMLDVTDQSMIDAAVKTVRERSGTTRFAGIVNNAGVARGGPLEFLALDEWREQLEINVIGQVAVTQAFFPLVREGSGRIVFIGSIGGRLGSPLMGPYSASKFALEGIAESLRLELHDQDIKVSLIEPGAVKTEIWRKGRETADRLQAEASPEMLERYGAVFDRVTESIERNNRNGVAPLAVCKAIEHALFAPRPRPRYLVGIDAKVGAFFARVLPDGVLDAVLRRVG
jgi:NAD(P)-dependent dehydrogenase (short-subunit alcohol dehydrogenase family)